MKTLKECSLSLLSFHISFNDSLSMLRKSCAIALVKKHGVIFKKIGASQHRRGEFVNKRVKVLLQNDVVTYPHAFFKWVYGNPWPFLVGIRCIPAYHVDYTTGLEWCGLLVDYCDVFISCLDSHSDGTHSLQSSHWWASDAMLNFLKSDEETNSSTNWIT